MYALALEAHPKRGMDARTSIAAPPPAAATEEDPSSSPFMMPACVTARSLKAMEDGRTMVAEAAAAAAAAAADDEGRSSAALSGIHAMHMHMPPAYTPGRGCCKRVMDRLCCRSYITRKTSLRNQLLPLINSPDVVLQAAERDWVRNQCLTLLEHTEYNATINRTRLTRFRRLLIFFGVFVSALILLENTTYVQDGGTELVFGFFCFTITMSLLNNYFTAVMTDLRYVQRATLYLRASTYLQSMLNTFLTCTQRYAAFETCTDAFRTFVRDVENVRVLIMQDEAFLMTAAEDKEQPSADELIAARQNWKNVMNRLTQEEATAMGETVHAIARRRMLMERHTSFLAAADHGGGGGGGAAPPLRRSDSILARFSALATRAKAADGAAEPAAAAAAATTSSSSMPPVAAMKLN